MNIEHRVCEMVVELLEKRYELPLREDLTSNAYCSMCGARHEENTDIYNQVNGYRTHSVGACIRNLQRQVNDLQQSLRKDTRL